MNEDTLKKLNDAIETTATSEEKRAFFDAAFALLGHDEGQWPNWYRQASFVTYLQTHRKRCVALLSSCERPLVDSLARALMESAVSGCCNAQSFMYDLSSDFVMLAHGGMYELLFGSDDRLRPRLHALFECEQLVAHINVDFFRHKIMTATSVDHVWQCEVSLFRPALLPIAFALHKKLWPDAEDWIAAEQAFVRNAGTRMFYFDCPFVRCAHALPFWDAAALCEHIVALAEAPVCVGCGAERQHGDEHKCNQSHYFDCVRNDSSCATMLRGAWNRARLALLGREAFKEWLTTLRSLVGNASKKNGDDENNDDNDKCHAATKITNPSSSFLSVLSS